MTVPLLNGKMLGRLPYDRTKPNLMLRRKAGATLTPPAQSDWGCDAMNYMALNDKYGCCTIADKAHVLTSQEFYGQGREVIVPDSETLKAYSAVSGFDPKTGRNDNGATLQQAYDYARKTGFVVAGTTFKLEAFAEIPTGSRGQIDHDLIKTCIDAFGSVATGMSFPDFAMDQFDANQAWDLPRNKRFKIEGGHDVPLMGYGGTGAGAYYDVWTWSRRQRVTVPFLERFMEEFWTQGELNWQRADGTVPNGIDGAAAQAEFNALVAGTDSGEPGWDGAVVPPVVVPPVDPPAPTDNSDAELTRVYDAMSGHFADFATQMQQWRAGKGL